MVQNKFIHETAEVSAQSIIDTGAQIWNWSKVREGAIIGESSKVGQCCYIDKNVKIGKRCKIQNGVSVYQGVEIEDEVFIGPNVTFTNDLYPRALNENWEIKKTLIKKGASIGANATIICGVVIGEYSMVGAGSVVTKDVAAKTLVLGNPAKFSKKVSD